MQKIIDSYTTVLKQFAVFEGRSDRAEFWYFVLGNVIITIVLGLIGFDKLSSLYSLAIFIPSLAVSVRRLHDIGKSGHMMWVTLIPLVGPIWLIVLLATKSETDKNKYD